MDNTIYGENRTATSMQVTLLYIYMYTQTIVYYWSHTVDQTNSIHLYSFQFLKMFSFRCYKVLIYSDKASPEREMMATSTCT